MDVEIGGVQFRCTRMPTRVQLYVVKRLAPVLQGFAPILGAPRDEAGNLVVSNYDIVAALSNTVHLLSDADADFVLDAALASVAWRQGSSWQPLRAQGGVFLVGAADRLDTQLLLLWHVLVASLSDFSLGALLQSLTGANGQEPNGMEREQVPPTAMAPVARPTMAS